MISNDMRRQLKSLGYSGTDRDLKTFQRAVGLPADGQPTSLTEAALAKAAAKNQAHRDLFVLGEKNKKLEKAERNLGLKADGVFDRGLQRKAHALSKQLGLRNDGDSFGPRLIQASAAERGRQAFVVARSVSGKAATWLQTRGPLASQMTDGIPANVNCANFVSSCLEKAGLISKSQHDVSVHDLSKKLARDPQWHKVPLSQARPGDVAVVRNGHHVVMYAGKKRDGTHLYIGSNNDAARGGAQYVSTKHYDTSGVVAVYQYRG